MARRTAQQTRRAILDAAISRFGGDGYRATKVADIARDAGVGGSVPYLYFADREALFLAAVDDDAAALIDEGVSPAMEGDLDRILGEVIRVVLGALDDHPLAKRVLAGLEPGVIARVLDTPALDDIRKRYAERLENGRLDGTARSDIDPAEAASALTHTALSFITVAVQTGEFAGTDGRSARSAALLEEAVTVPGQR